MVVFIMPDSWSGLTPNRLGVLQLRICPSRCIRAKFGSSAERENRLEMFFQYPDYHGVGDEWQKIDYANMAKVGQGGPDGRGGAAHAIGQHRGSALGRE
jgi:hypothetical protein